MSKRCSHEIDSTYPEFLGLLDTDPVRAFDCFYEFAWKLLLSNPPRALRSLQHDDQLDVIASVVERCWEDGCRRLRSYHDTGRPFAAWLTTVARNRALEWIEKMNRERNRTDDVELETIPGLDDPPISSPKLTTAIERCLAKMKEKCQQLVRYHALYGLTGQALAIEMGWPASQGKKAADDVSYCLERLGELLVAEGFNPEEAL